VCVFWRGEPLDLTPGQAHMMLSLLQQPIVSADELARVIGRVSSPSSVRVQISQLRRVLPQGVSIVAKYGTGYVLEVEDHQEAMKART
jgi:DNA-binding response OmpR family regulator